MLFSDYFSSFRLVSLTLCAGILLVGCDMSDNGDVDDFRGVDVESTVSTDDAVDGELEDSDSQLGDLNPGFSVDSDKYVDLYELEIDDGATPVEIDMTSNEDAGGVDTYLYLWERDGDFVASDDDDGSGLNSEILQTLEAGEYIIVASSYSVEQGAYELSIE